MYSYLILVPIQQDTVDRMAMTLGAVIQTMPETSRSQRGLARTFMCTMVCALVPDGETKDDCERVNCKPRAPSTPSSVGDLGSNREPCTYDVRREFRSRGIQRQTRQWDNCVHLQ